MDRQNDNRAIRRNPKVYGIRETPQHGSPGLSMSGKASGLATMHSTIASTALANSAPSLSRRSSYQRRVSRTSSSASGRKTTRRVTLFPTASGERRTRVSRYRVSFRARPTGDPAQPVVQGSTPVPPGARRRRDSPTAPSPARPDRRAGAATVARACRIPWRDSLMQYPVRQAGVNLREPTRTYEGHLRPASGLSMIDRPDPSNLALALLLSQVHPRAMVALRHANRTLPGQLGHDLGGHFSNNATRNVSNEEILIEIRNIKSGDNKGTIRGDMRYLLVSTDVRRHRSISRDYLRALGCHAGRRGFESRHSRHKRNEHCWKRARLAAACFLFPSRENLSLPGRKL